MSERGADPEDVVVGLVGPVPPWRSGIADQTVRLARAIQRLGVPVRVVTFERMYPRALYPGGSDRLPGGFPEDLDVKPLLDGTNPFSFRKAARALALPNVRLVIIPWWTAWWAPHSVLLLSALKALAPHAVRLLLCHNVVDHEASSVKRSLAHRVFRQADRLVVQNRATAERMRLELPGHPVEFIPHPSEPRLVLPERDKARARLGVPPEAPVFLFTGILRSYKGWDVLLATLPTVKAWFPDVVYVFAGEPWGEARDLVEKSSRDPNLRLELRYLAEAERDLWLDACDAVVCPYRHATGSGIAADAIAHGRPVIGTQVDGLADVIEDGVTGLLVPPEDPAALAGALVRFLREGLGPQLAANVVAHRGRFSPDEHARRVLRFGGIDR